MSELSVDEFDGRGPSESLTPSSTVDALHGAPNATTGQRCRRRLRQTERHDRRDGAGANRAVGGGESGVSR
jgi:hypothetical protein